MPELEVLIQISNTLDYIPLCFLGVVAAILAAGLYIGNGIRDTL